MIVKELNSSFRDLQEISTGSAILYKAKSNFLALKLIAKYTQTKNILPERNDKIRVYKLVQLSTYKFAHFMHIESPDEDDQQLKNWIIQSCQEDSLKLQ